jgi:hypothetical protein
MRRDYSTGWLHGVLAGTAVMFVAGLAVFALARESGYQAGFADGDRAARADFATLVCQLPGRVDASCAGIATLPLCDFEDGTPEGCLRRDSDGTWYWEINVDGGN